MKTEDFNYDLPEELIAQKPIEKRDESKLMILNKNTGQTEHKRFKNIIDYLNSGDVLVLNNTKVLPARLIGQKKDTGAIIELLLLNNPKGDIWECLAKPVKRLRIGTIIEFGSGQLKAQVLEILNDGMVHVQLLYEGILMEILEELGQMPLPPYIHEKLEQNDRYQTVYAKNVGSAAAPTAGLHFTKELLEKIKQKGVIIVEVTLHVGLGTFRPVTVDNIKEHKMHSEFYSMDSKTAEILNKAKKENRKIYAVGTTSTRVLETIMGRFGKFKQANGYTDIFIYPGYEFKAIDGLITNFHLPKSTLLMLVSALSSKEYILSAYKEAVIQKYRFFSFGDAMFIK